MLDVKAQLGALVGNEQFSMQHMSVVLCPGNMLNWSVCIETNI